MKIKHLSLFLSAGLSLQTIACGQTANPSPANENQTNKTVAEQKNSAQSKEIELPSDIKETDYEGTPDENILLLTVNDSGQISYENKLLDDAALKTVLAEYDEKHKTDPSTTGVKYPSLYDDKYKSFYLKADARASFSQIIKVLKAVQESSATSYRTKFIVKPQKEVSEGIGTNERVRTPNARYVVKLDLGIKKKVDENAPIPRPNPLTLYANLAADGKIKLNTNSKERSEFPAFLQNIFKQREENGVFREGTNEVEKEIILYPAPDAKYGDVIKFIDELYQIGANPVKLIIERPTESNGSGSGQGSGRGEGSGSGNGSGTVRKP